MKKLLVLLLSLAMVFSLTACGGKKADESFKITTTQLTNEPIAVCIKKGNTELKAKIDEAIVALQENGTMKSISEEWLGGDYVSDIDEKLTGLDEVDVTEIAEEEVTETTEATNVDEMTVLKIGVDDTYPPMEYRNDDMELVGFDIDFAKALGEELGVEVEFVSTAWDGIFAGLISDKYDVIISSVSITPERLQSFEFSKPYLANGQVIVVKEGDNSINSVEDLAGKKVGVQFQTTADIAATKQLETIEFELTQYDDIIQTFSDLKIGRINCIVVDYAVAIEYTKKK